YNAFCVMSDMAETRVGTITSGEDRFMQWKTIDGESESTAFTDFNVLFEGMLEKQRFFDILRNFICFSRDNGIKQLSKTMPWDFRQRKLPFTMR
ncbi:MAG: hypothetical protein J6S21_03380, partial [Victivallales bacterium]|nr:hypothetical protein [Victivallales bacterium]